MNNRSESTQLSLIILILLIALGALIDHYLAPAGLVVALPTVNIPWMAVWFLLVAVIAFAPPLVHLLGRRQAQPEQRFPEVYDTQEYHTAYMGATERLEEGE